MHVHVCMAPHEGGSNGPTQIQGTIQFLKKIFRTFDGIGLWIFNFDTYFTAFQVLPCIEEVLFP